MIISFFIALSWLLVASSAALANRMYRLEFAFVFLLVNFVNTNLYYLMGDAFHIFELPNDLQRYVSFSLIQSVIVPFFTAIAIDKRLRASSISGQAASLISAFAFLIGVEVLSASLRIVIYEQKRIFLWLSVYRLLLLLLPLIALPHFRRMCRRS